MFGKLEKNKVDSLVKPLIALNDVLKDSKDGVHIVCEMEDDKMFIPATNITGDSYGMYELKVSNVFEGYEKVADEVGIWDVADFINKINLFDNDIEFKYDDEQGLFTLSNDSDDTANFYSSDISIIKKGKRKLKVDKLEVGAKVNLTDTIGKLKKAIASYVGQDIFNVKGDSSKNEVTITIKSQQRKSNSYKTVLKDVEVENDFDTSFDKDQIKNVLNCNSELDVVLYTGIKDIAEFTYGNDDYNMKFYISPKEVV